jgi:hypothetical protein
MHDNITREPELRALWEELTGLEFDPNVPLGVQMRGEVERDRVAGGAP